MEYKKTVFLKDGRVCTLRNGMEARLCWISTF